MGWWKLLKNNRLNRNLAVLRFAFKVQFQKQREQLHERTGLRRAFISTAAQPGEGRLALYIRNRLNGRSGY